PAAEALQPVPPPHRRRPRPAAARREQQQALERVGDSATVRDPVDALPELREWSRGRPFRWSRRAMPGAQEIIDLLGLEPLPREGGYYRETYRSAGRVPGPGGRDRSCGTAIYYLLTPDTCSALH